MLMLLAVLLLVVWLERTLGVVLVVGVLLQLIMLWEYHGVLWGEKVVTMGEVWGRRKERIAKEKEEMIEEGLQLLWRQYN